MHEKLIPRMSVLLLLGASASAWASSVTITNPGFEDPATDFFSVGNITGWAITGSNAGVWNLNDTFTGFWSDLAPEGKQVAFVAREDPGGPASISQTLSDALLADSVYTLTGQVGHPIGFGSTLDPDTVYTVELLAGGTVLNSISATGPEGTFTPFQLTFDSTGSSLVGQALEIRLSSNQAQSAFDDIRLDVDPETSAVPEPSTSIVVIGGILVMLGYRRLKRVSC